ncbi:MAG: PhoH family protein [Eubacteriales bacterium]|nr:PhoH family protein [Eubacteriales bacterium]
MQRLTLKLDTMDQCRALFGYNDRNIRMIEDELSVRVHLRDNALQISGDKLNCAAAKEVIDQLLSLHEGGETIDTSRVQYYINMAFDGHMPNAEDLANDVVAYNFRGKKILNKTQGQREYTNSIRNNQLTIAMGPAGTGKTYLAVALAVVALKTKEVERLVLTRPAVEAGEKLGFLPGDMSQKVDPYLRPLYDALYDMLGSDGYLRYMERGMIEVAPLAFMRGRTLSNAFIILDEAQNTTTEQMKMFLTRIGKNTKCVVTGDLTQIDLPHGRKSGLRDAADLLKGIEDISIVNLTNIDVVRNDLVQKIVQAYESRTLEEK